MHLKSQRQRDRERVYECVCVRAIQTDRHTRQGTLCWWGEGNGLAQGGQNTEFSQAEAQLPA